MTTKHKPHPAEIPCEHCKRIVEQGLGLYKSAKVTGKELSK